jgi:hypothetical protein
MRHFLVACKEELKSTRSSVAVVRGPSPWKQRKILHIIVQYTCTSFHAQSGMSVAHLLISAAWSLLLGCLGFVRVYSTILYRHGHRVQGSRRMPACWPAHQAPDYNERSYDLWTTGALLWLVESYVQPMEMWHTLFLWFIKLYPNVSRLILGAPRAWTVMRKRNLAIGTGKAAKRKHLRRVKWRKQPCADKKDSSADRIQKKKKTHTHMHTTYNKNFRICSKKFWLWTFSTTLIRPMTVLVSITFN